MALRLEDKKAIVSEVAEVAANAHSAVIAEYRGLTVSEMTALRKQARESGVYVRVVKNTLTKIAVKDTEFECLQDALVGPLLLAFSQEGPSSAARLIKDFAKDHKKLVVKNVALGGKLLDASDLDAVAKLPTRDEAISSLMSVMKATITQFVRTLAEPHAKFVRTMAAVGEQKKENEGA
ncbi:MAG: 50S ribosomal protein L10 [Thiotrichaceae bacterium]|nr:50S ribosomal protein L10 [Thiotrichaceae bacterium]